MGASQLDRRELLTGGLAVSLALGGAAGSARAAPGASSEHWDMDVDVVCVGSGIAGCAAAATASDAGSSVVVIEKMPVLGGTTSKSGGVLWVPNNYLLREAGIADEKRDCMRYMARYAFPQLYDPESDTLGLVAADYRLLEAFYDNASIAVDKMRTLGAIRFQQFRLYQVNRPAPDYADHLPENKVPSGRCLEPIGGAEAIGGGSLIIGQIEEWLRARKVPLLTDTKVEKLITQGNRVIGVEVSRESGTKRIRARQGVVMASGGYAHNVELVQRHQPQLYGSCALPGSTGDFIPMAASVGAQMGNLGTAWRTQVIADEAFDNRMIGQGTFFLPGDSMMVVNKYGHRVMNEKRDYNDRTAVHFVYDPVHEDYPNQLLFMLFDSRTLDAYGGNFPIPVDIAESSTIISGPDWDSLSRAIDARLKSLASKSGGVRLSPQFADNLKESAATFSRYAKAGEDPEFQRGRHAYDREWNLLFSERRKGTTQPVSTLPNSTMYPLAEQGPYYAFILSAGALDTSGGPLINDKAQVIGFDDTPIAGLYGAGNCVASPTRGAYFGAGGTLGPALAFGYIAGLGVSAETRV